MRFTGGGNYCGILVVLMAAWAIAQSMRRQNSPFTDAQKKLIWFWAPFWFGSLLLAWGRFAPMFYGTLYQLPYFSTIRNPAKFLFFFSWALVILFAYGIHALSRRYFEIPAGKSSPPSAQLKSWWAKAGGFDRKWTFACAAIHWRQRGWLVHLRCQTNRRLVHYLQTAWISGRGLGRGKSPRSASARLAGWLLIFAAALGTVARWSSPEFLPENAPDSGGILLGAFSGF